jgi:hypothetical protein
LAHRIFLLPGLINYFSEIQVFNDMQIKNDTQIATDQLSTDSFKDLLIFNLTTSFNENDLNTRAIITNVITCFLYEEIYKRNWHKKRLDDCVRQLYSNLDLKNADTQPSVTNMMIIKLTCDNLRVLSQLSDIIFGQFNIQYAIDIISNLNNCLVKLTSNSQYFQQQASEEYSKTVISNMFALLDWYMYSPLDKLKEHDRASLLNNIFKLLVHVCNKFRNCLTLPIEHIYLTAKYIIGHLLTQLNHYPFGVCGTSKIVSTISEYTDQTYSTPDLACENPCIQYFTVNNQYLITFVELDVQHSGYNILNFLDMNSLNTNKNFKTASTLCRFIIRDNCGKYCWDCYSLKGLLQFPFGPVSCGFFYSTIFFNWTFRQKRKLQQCLRFETSTYDRFE